MASNFNGNFVGDGSGVTNVNAQTLDGRDGLAYARGDYSAVSGLHYRGWTHLLCRIPNDGSDLMPEATFNGTVTLHRGHTSSGLHHSEIILGIGVGYNSYTAHFTPVKNGHNLYLGTCTYGGNKYLALRVQWYGNSQDYVLRAAGAINGSITFNNAIHTTGDGVGSSTQGVVANSEIVNSWQDLGAQKIWHSDNDGAGSGLDADLLDGIDSTSFLRSDTADTAAGSITFSATNYHSGNSYSIYGPNTTWGKYLNVGGDGHSSDATHASVATTNGNLHLDAASGAYATYFNWYTGTNGVYFGNGAGAQIGRVDGAGTATFSGDVTAYSDMRLKTDIEKIADATAKVEQLNGVNFTRTTDDKRSTGLIAQEVLAVLPEAVNEDEEGFYSVKYGNLVGLLVEAIKEQNARITELENKLNGK